MKRVLLLILAAWVVGAGFAQSETSGQSDLALIQGRWRLESETRNGAKVALPPCYYEFREATMTVHPQGRRASFYTLKIESGKNPKELDIIATWPDGGVVKSETIYEIAGDTLRWCSIGGKRPAKFPSTSAPLGTVVVLRRVPAVK